MKKKTASILRGIILTAVILAGSSKISNLIAQTGNEQAQSANQQPSTTSADVYKILKVREGKLDSLEVAHMGKWTSVEDNQFMYYDGKHYWLSFIDDDRWRIDAMDTKKNDEEHLLQIMFGTTIKDNELMKIGLLISKKTGEAVWTWWDGDRVVQFHTELQPKK